MRKKGKRSEIQYLTTPRFTRRRILGEDKRFFLSLPLSASSSIHSVNGKPGKSQKKERKKETEKGFGLGWRPRRPQAAFDCFYELPSEMAPVNFRYLFFPERGTKYGGGKRRNPHTMQREREREERMSHLRTSHRPKGFFLSYSPPFLICPPPPPPRLLRS